MPAHTTGDAFLSALSHPRAKAGVQLILHRGARARAGVGALAVDDPAGLLTWLADDRASVTLRDLADVDAKRDALSALVRAWITHV